MILEVLETQETVEIQEVQVSRVLPARLESRVLVAGMELWVLEVVLVLPDYSDSLGRLGHLEMWDFRVSKVLLENKALQDSLVHQVTLVLSESRDLRAVKEASDCLD